MQELQLSDDLTTIETEIKTYQNIAGESIFEIGRRLKHVKENDLVHGEFINWVENSLNMDRTTASKFMKISKELSNDEPVQHLGFKALYQIATIPEEKREEKHKTSSGEMKNSYEMTTKEREEFKRHQRELEQQNTQLQSQLEQAQRSEEIARKQLEDEQDKDPEVIERYMEPEDYQELKESNKQLQDYLNEVSNHNKKLNSDIEKLKQQRSETDEKSAKYDELNQAINSMNAKLNEGQQRLKAQKEIYDLVKGSEKVIREVAPLCYLAFSRDIIDNDYARKPIEKIIDDLTDMASRLRKQIKQGDVIDV